MKLSLTVPRNSTGSDNIKIVMLKDHTERVKTFPWKAIQEYEGNIMCRCSREVTSKETLEVDLI